MTFKKFIKNNWMYLALGLVTAAAAIAALVFLWPVIVAVPVVAAAVSIVGLPVIYALAFGVSLAFGALNGFCAKFFSNGPGKITPSDYTVSRLGSESGNIESTSESDEVSFSAASYRSLPNANRRAHVSVDSHSEDSHSASLSRGSFSDNHRANLSVTKASINASEFSSEDDAQDERNPSPSPSSVASDSNRMFSKGSASAVDNQKKVERTLSTNSM